MKSKVSRMLIYPIEDLFKNRFTKFRKLEKNLGLNDSGEELMEEQKEDFIKHIEEEEVEGERRENQKISCI
jgi:hypothetical protein